MEKEGDGRPELFETMEQQPSGENGFENLCQLARGLSKEAPQETEVQVEPEAEKIQDEETFERLSISPLKTPVF